MSVTITRVVYAYLGATWTDITSDVVAGSERASWGIKSNAPFDRLASTGTFNFSVNNDDGRYLPGGGSVRSDDWKKGCKIKVTFTYNGASYIRFYGIIDSMRIDAGTSGNRKVHVTVVDWLDYAAKYPLDNPAIQEDKRADEALTTIVDAMPIAPLGTDFEQGTNTLPLVFSDTSLKTRAYSEFQKLALSELGYIYLKKDPSTGETLVFRNSEALGILTQPSVIRKTISSGFLQQETGDYLLQENNDKILIEGYTDEEVSITDTMMSMDVSYGDNLINRITTSVYPARVDTASSLVYQLDAPIYLAGGTSKTFNVQFTEPTSKRLVAALPPDDTYPTTLIHFEESTSTNPIVEDSGKSWGFQGDAQLVTEYKKFGARSLYLDGSGAYADGVTSDDYNLGSGDFTIEWWEYRFNADSGEAILNRDITTYTTYPPFLLGYSDGTNADIFLSSDGATWDIANGRTFGAISTNQWVHYALTREGSTFRAFKNGTLADQWTSSAALIDTTGTFAIGRYGSAYVTACIDEVRIVKGQAKYTENFTVPSEEFALSGTFFNAYTQSNRGGTELTGDFTLSITYGAAGAEVTVTNGSDFNGYLTALNIYSYIVESVSAITDIQEDSTSYLEYGFHEERLEQRYKQELDAGAAEAQRILAQNKDPRTHINRVTFNANRDESHAMYFLGLDVGDAPQIAETQTGINALYAIMGVEWDAMPSANGGVIVNYSWIVKEIRRQQELSLIAFNFSATNDEYIRFENQPYIRVPNRAFRFSFTRNSAGSTQHSIFSSGLTDGIDIYVAAGDIWITRRTEGTLDGSWYADTNVPNGFGGQVVIFYDGSSASNVPQIYYNGVSQTVVVETTPTTALQESEGFFYIGSTRRYKGATLFTQGNPGDVEDFRIYDMDRVSVSPSSLVSSIIAEPDNENIVTDGLVFRCGGIPSADYAAQVGNAIAETTPVFDMVTYIEGYVNDNPVAIAPS